MRRRSNSFGEVFGPDTDIVISLFAIMTCVFAFVMARNFRTEGELKEARAQVITSEEDIRVKKAELESLADQLATANQDLTKLRGQNELLLRLRSEMKRLLENRKAAQSDSAVLLPNSRPLSLVSLVSFLQDEPSSDATDAADTEEPDVNVDVTPADVDELLSELKATVDESNRIESLEKEIASQKTEIESLETDIQGLETDLASVEATLAKKLEEITALEAVVEAGTKKRMELELALAELELLRSNEKKTSDAQIATLQASNLKLAADLKTEQDKNALLTRSYQQLRDAQTRLAVENAQLRTTVATQGALRKEILEIKGDLNRVVFIVDMSGSMQASGRWEQSQKLIESWLEYLPVEEAALVTFNDKVQTFPADGSYLALRTDNSDEKEARAKFVAFLRAQTPYGPTATLSAVKRAFEYEDVDTIILFTDGRPQELGEGRRDLSAETLVNEIIDFVKRSEKKVVINTVGLGDYFNEPTSKGEKSNSQTFRLLVELSKITEGSFRGR